MILRLNCPERSVLHPECLQVVVHYDREGCVRRISFRQRLSVLSSLLRLCLGKEDEHVVESDRIRQMLLDARALRNNVVHSVWVRQSDGDDEHAVLRIKSTAKQKRGPRTDFESIDLEDLRLQTDSIGEVYGQLCLFELHFQ